MALRARGYAEKEWRSPQKRDHWRHKCVAHLFQHHHISQLPQDLHIGQKGTFHKWSRSLTGDRTGRVKNTSLEHFPRSPTWLASKISACEVTWYSWNINHLWSDSYEVTWYSFDTPGIIWFIVPASKITHNNHRMDHLWQLPAVTCVCVRLRFPLYNVRRHATFC